MAKNLTECDLLPGAYQYLGPSLLEPISQTPRLGLVSGYWDVLRDFDSPVVQEAAKSLSDFAAVAILNEDQSVEDISVEWTRLFVGPPKPAAAPWESFYRADNVKSGFGPATFEMQQLLRDYELALGGDCNQYADHMGIELLLLAEMSLRAKSEEDLDKIGSYMVEHPLGWIEDFEQAVAACEPDGYYRRIISLSKALMERHLEILQGAEPKLCS